MTEKDARGPSTAYRGEKASRYDQQRFTSRAGRLIHAREAHLVESIVGRSDSVEILEVGCGTGRFLLQLARSPERQLVAIDGSMEMVEQVRARDFGNARVETIVADASSLPFDDAAFDCCYSVRLLNQTESRDYALSVVREMARVTRPEGLILVEFVNAYRPRVGPGRRPTVRLSPRAVKDALEEGGARVSTIRGSFVLGMSMYIRSPQGLLPVLDLVDRLLSKLLPRVAARVYVDARKDAVGSDKPGARK